MAISVCSIGAVCPVSSFNVEFVWFSNSTQNVEFARWLFLATRTALPPRDTRSASEECVGRVEGWYAYREPNFVCLSVRLSFHLSFRNRAREAKISSATQATNLHRGGVYGHHGSESGGAALTVAHNARQAGLNTSVTAGERLTPRVHTRDSKRAP